MSSIIKVENLSKKYIIGHQSREKYTALRDVLVNKIKTIGKKSSSQNKEEFWALKDVSLEIQQGDRVGIIGRNGAGKSTFLKILSRITEPTSGRISINGRIASLLEVGTGFHPELTGRENIYLNGAILGMTNLEIKRKFDEIVEFAEIEKFLDTPVKRYSSGMYVRLAFSVAAHLEPEILVVDEVLAVGDAQFQKKCLGKMSEMGSGGRTVLFVSHNIAAIQSLCNNGVVLEKGLLRFNGKIENAIQFYSNSNFDRSTPLLERIDRKGHGAAKIINIIIKNKDGLETNCIGMGEAFSVTLEFAGNLRNAIIGILFGNTYFTQFMRAYSYETCNEVINITDGSQLTVNFDKSPLIQGSYNIHTWLGNIHDVADYVENAHELVVEVRDIFNTGKILNPEGNKLFCYHTWDIKN